MRYIKIASYLNWRLIENNQNRNNTKSDKYKLNPEQQIVP